METALITLLAVCFIGCGAFLCVALYGLNELQKARRELLKMQSEAVKQTMKARDLAGNESRQEK